MAAKAFRVILTHSAAEVFISPPDCEIRLSRERALAVSREIQRPRIGVAAALGLGDALELDRAPTAEGLALNRRADVILIESADPLPVESTKNPKTATALGTP